MKKKVVIRGPVLSRSGYGEQARFALRSLRRQEDKIDLYLINTNWGQTGWVSQYDEEKNYVDYLIGKTFHHMQGDGKFDVSLQVTIPNEWEKIAPVNVGYTAGIETTKVSPQWVEKSIAMDRIVVTSSHSKNTLENTSYPVYNRANNEKVGEASVRKSNIPITVVNYPAKKTKKKSLKLDLETDFNFLMVSQWGPRKNASNTIKWFVENFKDNPNVGLVIKGFFRNNSTMDKMQFENLVSQFAADGVQCKLYVLHGDMSDSEMIGLYSHPKIKAFISLSHGEGYGLPLFESAYCGLPVITTNWSGQCDFLNMPQKQRKKGSKKKTQTVLKPMFAEVEYTLGPIQQEAVWDGVLQADSMWCYADESSFKKVVSNVYEDYSKYEEMAKKLKTWIKKEFDEDKQYEAFANAVIPVETQKEEEPVISFE